MAWSSSLAYTGLKMLSKQGKSRKLGIKSWLRIDVLDIVLKKSVVNYKNQHVVKFRTLLKY